MPGSAHQLRQVAAAPKLRYPPRNGGGRPTAKLIPVAKPARIIASPLRCEMQTEHRGEGSGRGRAAAFWVEPKEPVSLVPRKGWTGPIAPGAVAWRGGCRRTAAVRGILARSADEMAEPPKLLRQDIKPIARARRSLTKLRTTRSRPSLAQAASRGKRLSMVTGSPRPAGVFARSRGLPQQCPICDSLTTICLHACWRW